MKNRILSLVLTLVLVLPMTVIYSDTAKVGAAVGDVTTITVENLTADQMAVVDRALEHSSTYILTKIKRMGGSHFSYTEDLAEEIIYGTSLPEKGEASIKGTPSRMVLLSVEKASESSITVTEEILVDLPSGVVRDPDVSADGKTVIYSQRANKYEDFKIYEMTLADRSVKQLTFGDGVSDFEPIYLPDGNIMFSSSRIIQTVDCWKVPVSNLFIMNPDGSNIRRIGYDQVHTTTPKLTGDGRIIYTRWDYNDRTQLYIQSLFQMMPDGTNQTELYGNNSNFPTSLIHAREIPGESGKYMAIATGHHTTQLGKLVTVDVNIERNSKDAVNFVFPDEYSEKTDNVDQYGQVGAIYRYPYPIDSETFFIAADLDGIIEDPDNWDVWKIPSSDAQFNLYLSDGSSTENLVPISYFENNYSPAQVVPVKTREMFLRSSMVNYAKKSGTYYIGNVYAGEGMTGVERGTAKELRVVALKFRNYAIGATVQPGADPFSPISTGYGAWDVKAVLGSVPIEEDGSCLFEAPSDTPLYFQVLDDEGCVIASMRSWTTLMPGESFSCVGCHENKDNVPPANATPTLALKKGVQKITREAWQEDDIYADYDPYTDEPIGFDYEDEVQKIFNEKTTTDYSNISQAMVAVSASSMTGLDSDARPVAILADDKWDVSFEAQSGTWYAEDFDSSAWHGLYAPFGAHANGLCEVNSVWESGELYLRRKFTADNYMISEYTPLFEVISTGNYTVYLNGELALSGSGASETVRNFFTDDMISMLRMGENTIAVKVQAPYLQAPVFSFKMYSDNKPVVLPEGDIVIPDDAILEAYTDTLIDHGADWTYFMNTSNSLDGAEWYAEDYDTSTWLTGAAPFGNGTVTHNTVWYEKNASGYLWVRKTFTIPDQTTLDKADFRLNAYYAQAPEFYVNGKKFLNNTTSGSGGWFTSWGYRDVYLDEDFKSALKVGTNTIAVRLTNPTNANANGGAFDLGLYADFRKYDEKYLVEARSELKYSVIDNATGAPENWTAVDFDDSSWTSGEGPIGNVKCVGTNSNFVVAGGNTMYVRQSFEIEDLSEYEGVTLKMNLLYDQDPSIYLNGNLIYSTSGYTTGYTTIDLGSTCTKYLREGTNVLATAAPNEANGEAGYDMALLASGIVERNLITESYTTTLIDKGSSWSYNVASSDTLGTAVHAADFDASSWSTGNAPFGNGTKRTYATTWGELQVAGYLWVRKHFTVTADMLAKADFSLNAFYAQAPEFYVNGTKFLNNTAGGSGGYYTGWGYRDVYLDEAFKDALVVGDNVISVRLTNPTNAYGGYFDLGLYAHFKAFDEKYLVDPRATWTNVYTAEAPDSSWTSNTFDDSSWTLNDAPFGNMKAVGYNTEYKGDGNTLYARTAFNIENLAEYSNCGIKLYALYDEDPKLYLNGNLIWEKNGYNTGYDIFDLGTAISKYFVQGQNILAMEVPNASGEIGADFALYAYDIKVGGEQSSIVSEPSKIYLGGKLMPAPRMKKSFPLSYLVLTGSTPKSNIQWIGDYQNSYINWIYSMSKPEMLEPYEYGSKTSTGLFTLLEPYNLTDAELRTIRAWIDLGVPAYGKYDKNVNWSDNDLRDATEKDSKRDFYEMLDTQAKKKLAGLEMPGEITISFAGADGVSTSATDSESAYITIPRKYAQGDTFTVTLPEGHKYLAFTFTPKVAESIIYVPDGVFTYTFPSYASTVFPTEAFTLYTENTASARIPTNDELSSVRNLALNPFDLDDATGIYPHATVSSRYSSNYCRARALIDGFEMNLLHYYDATGLGYPVMSWGLNQGDASDDYASIDFGRSVCVSSVGIKIRADFDHDDYFTSCTVELSDGTTAWLAMKKTSEMMWLEFDEPVTTTSIKIKELNNTTTDRWPAVTEIRVMGCEASDTVSE